MLINLVVVLDFSFDDPVYVDNDSRFHMEMGYLAIIFIFCDNWKCCMVTTY